jgi:asparagine synthase (glutamine-hydrolysing)
MSGIAGVVFKQPRSEVPATLNRMSLALKHRGNDEDRFVLDDRIALATRGEPDAGYRACLNDDNEYITAFDGWLSNSDELITRYGLEASADFARIVAAGYRADGEGVFAKLRGSFALVIVRRDGSDEVLLARDLFAGRSLYYAVQGERLWFASDIRAILQDPTFNRDVAVDALPQIMAFGASMGPETPFKDVMKVIPGQWLKGVPWRRLGYDWFCLPENLDIANKSESAWARDIWGDLNEAILRDNGLSRGAGVMLSGGVDSSLLALALAESKGGGLPAVTIGARDWKNDETIPACDVANHCGLVHRPIYIAPDSGVLDALAEAIWRLEEPTRFYNSISLSMALDILSGELRGLYTGEGADLLLGSRSSERGHWVQRLNSQPRWIASSLRNIPDFMLKAPRIGSVVGNLRRMIRQYDSVADYTYNSFLFNPEILNPPYEVVLPPHLQELQERVSEWSGDVQDMLLNMLGLGHCWNERFEKIGAHSRIDVFNPYQTHSLFRLGLQMPLRRKYSRRGSKPVLRRMVSEKISPSIARRRKIQLSVPMRSWWNESNDLRAAVSALKDPNNRVREYLDGEVMDRALEEFESGPVDNAWLSRNLFSMVGLDLWLRTFIDTQAPCRLDVSNVGVGA